MTTLALLVLLLISRASAGDVHPLLLAERFSGESAALRLRIQPKAVLHFNQIASDLLVDQLPRLVIPSINHKLPADQGIIRLSRIHISRFKKAQIHEIKLAEPNRIIWKMENLNVGLIGDLSGNVNILVPLDLEGKAEVLAEGLNFHLNSSIGRNENGSAVIKPLACTATIRTVDVMNHNGGIFGLALNVFKQAIAENVRHLLMAQICKEVKKFIDEVLNRRLADTQSKVSLNETMKLNSFGKMERNGTSGPIDAISDALMDKKMVSDFFIDYRLTETPICDHNGLELASVGEISYLGLGNTPFDARPLEWPAKKARNSSSISIMVADYLPNTFLYHAYKQGFLKFILNDKSPNIGSFLKTKCDENAVCISEILPALGDHFPDHPIELVFVASRAPAILFSQKQGGVISINVHGMLLLYAIEGSQKKQASVFHVDVVAENKLRVQNNTLQGTVSLSRFSLRNETGIVKVTDSDLSDLGILCSELLENLFNTALENGFPIPLPPVVQLDNVDVEIMNRNVFINADFRLEKRALGDLIVRAIFGVMDNMS
ncbi:hypothetical protein QR680_008453 [Steinernema hermaphroditum]|uniref:Lipid-binding serum glycoprotein C-terminal domain-containing protein n=1 Tax=Steinernema hermaphroditum TaxID=289476 RepID=A0AA39M840_9BILA|nr:hypothetical protein QR680_008453 [Steinernema hermaphroditum]